MRSFPELLSLVKRPTILVSTNDTIALSFGFASTFIAIVTVFVTRRAYQIASLFPNNLFFVCQFRSGLEVLSLYTKAD
jgi:hypothetical protein